MTAAILDGYVDWRMPAAKAVELLTGAPSLDDLLPQRAEMAADYASL